jgi:uncharacterized membrane protein YphA (DoxX/SURF4 family)
MKISNISSFAENHFDYFMDAVRIYLGVGLIFKGISFLTHSGAMPSLADTPFANLAAMVPYIHIISGALLTIGLLPRLAALANIPILLAAVFFVHAPVMHTIRGREGVEYSALVLFLLCLIAIKGGGPLSVMRMMRREPAAPSRFAFQRWADENADLFTDVVRIYLGLGLFIKGIYIMDHRDELLSILNSGPNMSFSLMAAAHYVIPAHLVGGVLLILGLLTRWAAAAQLPPLIGAFFYAFLPNYSSLEMRQSFEFTGLVMFLLALVTIFGAGRLCAEHPGRRSLAYTPALQPSH